MDVPALLAAWQPVLWAVGAVLVARVVVVYGLGWAVGRIVAPVPRRWQLVLVWGGLRGAVSLALALILPAALGPDRALLQVMALGVVLFTLLAQGTTMRPLLRRLGLVRQRSAAEREALRAQRETLGTLRRDGVISDDVYQRLAVEIDAALAAERLPQPESGATPGRPDAGKDSGAG